MPLFRRRLKREALGSGEPASDPASSDVAAETRTEGQAPVERIIGADAKADLALVMAQYGAQSDTAKDDEEMMTLRVEVTPIVRIANTILQQAIKEKASHILLESSSSGIRVRYRLDGILHETMQMPTFITEPLIGRFKRMAEMEVGRKGVVQHGQIKITYDNHPYNLRITSTPTLTGEQIVFHVFDAENVYRLKKLGFTPKVLAQTEDLMARKTGVVLVTGERGGGVTTLLYALLNQLNSIETNNYAIGNADYELGGVTAIDPDLMRGLTQAQVLQNVSRQNADIILVDAPTNRATLREVVTAAEEGALVLCGVYGQDTAGTLINLASGETDLRRIGQNVLGILAQRLGRKICSDCKEAYEEDAINLRRFGFKVEDPEQKVTLFRGRGCETCRNTGYKGRIGFYELLRMNAEIAEMIVKRVPLGDLKEAAKANGMHELREDGLIKVLAGQTTPDEVMRVVFTAG